MFTNGDQAFARLFRVQYPIDASSGLDRLSMLACQRQGIDPKDLLPPQGLSLNSSGVIQPVSPARSNASSTSATRLDPSVKLEVANKRRLAKINIVELERRSMLDVVFSAQERKKLTHEQEQLQIELLKARESHGGLALANNPQEERAIESLLGNVHDLNPQKEKLFKQIEETKKLGELEIERMRQRQLRFVMNDVQREVERQEIQSHIAEREAAFKEAERQRRLDLAAQAAQRARLHRKKMTALRIRNEVMYQHKKEEMEYREQHQSEVFAETQRQKNERLRKMHEAAVIKEQESKQKAERVKQQEALRCDELEAEMQNNDLLHDERKNHIHLHLHVAREQRRVEALRKHLASQQKMHQQDDGAVAARKRMEEMELAVQRNRAEQLKAQEDALKRQQAAEREAAERAEKKRKAQQRRQEKRACEILVHEIRKEEHLQAVRETQEAERQLIAEMEAQKRENHADNLERLKRLQEYRQSVKDSMLREQQERDRANKAMKQEMSIKLQRARQKLVQDRESVAERIVQMRSSPKWRRMSPREMLAATMASVQRASSANVRSNSSSRARSGNQSPGSEKTQTLSLPRPGTGSPQTEGTTPSRLVLAANVPKRDEEAS